MAVARRSRSTSELAPATGGPPEISRPAPSANEGTIDWSSTIELVGSVLVRLSDVMGPGALYALVRYGSLDAGTRLGAKIKDRDPEAALKEAGRLLHLDVTAQPAGIGSFRLHIRPPPYLTVAKGGTLGLIVGLFEGFLSSVQRTKYQLSGEPTLGADGEMTILLKE